MYLTITCALYSLLKKLRFAVNSVFFFACSAAFWVSRNKTCIVGGQTLIALRSAVKKNRQELLAPLILLK